MVLAKGAALERLVDGEAQGLGARPQHDALPLESFEDVKIHQFVVEGDDLNPLGQAANGVCVGRGTQYDVGNGLCRGVVAGASEYRQVETEIARALAHHVCELSGAHHANAGELVWDVLVGHLRDDSGDATTARTVRTVSDLYLPHAN